MTDLDDVPYLFDEVSFGTTPYTATPPLTADQIDQLLNAYAALPPLEPIRATQEQLVFLRLALPKWEPRWPGEPAPLPSVPIHLVEDVEESTPWLREAFAAFVERIMRVDFPTGGFGSGPDAS